MSHALVALFSFVAGGPNYNIFFESHNPTAACIIYIVFQLTMGIVLINLLFAILTSSYEQVRGGWVGANGDGRRERTRARPALKGDSAAAPRARGAPPRGGG
jgi:hypothetical protein